MLRHRGIIFDIQKFSVHDGPGIRTTVFLKGCPLRCLWCHNPESWQVAAEILFSPDKCISCGGCVRVCPWECHILKDALHGFDRTDCIGCGLCAKHCLTGALELCGSFMTADEVMAEVLKDRAFYENSGGGLTVSGGEPMAQFEFMRKLLELAKENGLHVCLETCGFAPWERYMELLPLVDLFLFDIKSVDQEKHRKFTGQDNVLILDNLRALDRAGAALHLRCPVVAGLNDSQAELRGIAVLAEGLTQVQEIDVEPYHPLGASKAYRLGLTNGFEAPFTPKEISDQWVKMIAENTKIPVRKQSEEIL